MFRSTLKFVLQRNLVFSGCGRFLASQPILKNSAFDHIYSALEAYKKTFNTVDIPIDYVVPAEDTRFPNSAWEMNLGEILDDIRFNKSFSEYNEHLIKLGINVEEDKVPNEFEKVFSALQIYKLLHGNVAVPLSYFVLKGTSYPPETWGMKLGVYVDGICLHNVFSEHRDKLTELGLEIVVKDSRGFDETYSALVAYKSIHNNVQVGRKFVVPTGDSAYPEETWGMKLGMRVMNIRNGKYYPEHRKQLQELGIVYKDNNVKKE